MNTMPPVCEPVGLKQYKRPFYNLDAPEMPPPGPDFIDAAVALGDDKPKIVSRGGKIKEMESGGQHLSDLYYSALYDENFSLRIQVKGRHETPTFLRGHIWGYKVTGPHQAPVMVVGKWPGNEELTHRRNFKGPSGEIMIRALDACEVDQSEYGRWYVTNLIKHANLDPAGNRVAVNWLKNCMPLLEEELRIVRPKFVLALGAEAAKALISDKIKVDAAQGNVYTRKIAIHQKKGDPEQYHEMQIMVCIHPARVARQADKLPEFNGTIRRFVNLVRGKELNVEEKIDHRVIYHEQDLSDLVDEVIAEGDKQADPQIIAIDCEWHGEYPTEPGAWLRTIQFSHKAGFAACVVLREQGGLDAFCPTNDRMIPHLKRLLINTDKRRVRLAGHNLRADLPWVCHGLDKELGEALLKQFTGPELPEDTRTLGGFDTMLAAHAVTEAPGDMGFKLEVLALNICGIRRYDTALLAWKSLYCTTNRIEASDLEGYGECPDDVLHPYACWDADVTRRLVDAYNKPGGLLDHDQYGNSSRVPFWISMRASPGFLEMEMTGLLIDRQRGDKLTDMFTDAVLNLTGQLQTTLNWPQFNPKSTQQCRNLLFGDKYSGKLNKKTGEIVRVAPPQALTFELPPVKSSGKPSKAWDWIERRKQTDIYTPCTDKEVLGILVTNLLTTDPTTAAIVKTLRYTRFASQVLTSSLRRPLLDKVTGFNAIEDGERVYEKGLLSYLHADGRVRTHLFQTKETGRASSSRPPLQNLSKRREKEYKEILGKEYKYPLRSMIQTTPGYVMVEADYQGAELFMMAVQAGDPDMIEHCQRGTLPEDHPNYYDIHSNVAVDAFKLTVKTQQASDEFKLKIGDPLPPTKKGLSLNGDENLRNAAKTIAFGIPYGRGSAAVIRSVEEEGVFLTLAEAEAIRETLLGKYSRLPDFLDRCKERVTAPGWMANCFGRYRRFQFTGVDDSGDMGRQACNFPIQSGVADAVSRALDYLHARHDRYENGRLRYRMVLQIHDAILFEVLINSLEWFIGTHDNPGVLGQCMTQRVPIWSCDLDGKRLKPDPYYLGIDTGVATHWGEKLMLDEGKLLGVPERFCTKPKK
jgi:DNA polymerase